MSLNEKDSLVSFLKHLVDKGLDINTVYDIGAYEGKWSTEIKSLVFPNSDFVMFEANPNCVPILEQTKIPYIRAVLSSPDKQTVNFYNTNDSNGGYYKDTTSWYDSQESIEVPCVTLDKIVSEYKLPHPDFIKIDTQGSELDILSGAESIIDNVKMVYIECPITNYNQGAPNISDYLTYFRNKRFIPVDIFEKHIGENTLVQIDILFIKEDTKYKLLGPNNSFRPFGRL
jgi:FkbM family methyltransferase